jgi:hypothetical protein
MMRDFSREIGWQIPLTSSVSVLIRLHVLNAVQAFMRWRGKNRSVPQLIGNSKDPNWRVVISRQPR